MRCSQSTRRGEPCRNQALAGTGRCWSHRAVIDEQAVGQLVSWLRAGNYPDVAALATGVPLDALPAETRARLEQARAEGEARGIATIAAAARDNWQAAAWLLERQYPGRWARPALRADERSAGPVAGPDGLDELSGRRQARRTGM